MNERKNPLKVSVSLRIETTDKVFGQGHVQLMEKIEDTGSLNSACMKLGISYSKAWKIITHAEKELGFPLLNGTIGGKGGGGSTLTDEGRDFLARYKALCNEVNAVADSAFLKYFGDK